MATKKYNFIFALLASVLLLLIAAPNIKAQTRHGVDNFAPRVCNLFPRGGGGNITSQRGIGCSWNYVDGAQLKSDERIVLTAHRNAPPEIMSAYKTHLDSYFDGMLKYKIGTATPLTMCPSGSGRKYVREHDINLIIVEGYLICEGHFISAEMVIRKGGYIDPKQLFDDLVPQVLPLINSRR